MHLSKLTVPFVALVTLGTVACGASDAGVSPPDPQGPSGDGIGGEEPPLGGGPYAVATLAIEVDHPDEDAISYELACFGDTATLIPADTPGVDAARACTSLARPEVEDHLVDGPPSDQACTQVYGGPETARIVGRVNDRPVDLAVDRADGCGIDTWDVLLGEVLPQARGT